MALSLKCFRLKLQIAHVGHINYAKIGIKKNYWTNEYNGDWKQVSQINYDNELYQIMRYRVKQVGWNLFMAKQLW